MLHTPQTLFVLEAGCDEIHSPYTLGGLLHPLYRRLRPEQCLKGIDGGPCFLKCRPESAYQGPSFRRNDRETWIAGKLLEEWCRESLPIVRCADERSASQLVAQSWRHVEEEALSNLDHYRWTAQRIGLPIAKSGGNPRCDQTERRKPRWSEGTIDALEDVEREVDAQLLVARRRVGRQRVECGDRPRLCEPEHTFGINGPLGILRLAVIRLDACSKRGQCANLLIGEAGFIPAGAFLTAQRASSCG